MSDYGALSLVGSAIEHLANSISFQNHLKLAEMGALFTDNLAVEVDLMRTKNTWDPEFVCCKICKMPLKFVRDAGGYSGAYLHLINFYSQEAEK